MKRIFIILPTLVLLCQMIYAQESNNEIIKSFYWQIDNPERSSSTNIRQALKTQLNIPEDYEFICQSIESSENSMTEVDDLGYLHERYTQYYKGIKVESSDIRVRYLNSLFQSANGNYIDMLNIDTSIVLSKEDAIQIAITYISAVEYMWEDENEGLSFYPNAEIVICENDLDEEDTLFYTAYKIDVFAKKPFRYDYVYIDAKTGNIIDFIPTIEIEEEAQFAGIINTQYIRTANTQYSSTTDTRYSGTADTRYSGTRIISTKYWGDDGWAPELYYSLDEYSRGGGIETWKLPYQGCSVHEDAKFWDNDNNWTTDEHAPDKDNGALDAHWGVMMTYDYFNNIHGRNSYDNNGGKIKNYVHYCWDNYDGALWLENTLGIAYGNGRERDIWTSLDIVAHEFGIGVCQFSAKLKSHREFGAIRMGLSDIWAACVRNYATPEKEIWLYGFENSYDSIPIRNMSDPKTLNHPNTYKGQYWRNAENIFINTEHINCNVMSHWFYILSVGKIGKVDDNPIGESYDVTGIGIEKAERIVYRAETKYMTKCTKFSDAREYTIKAAEDLYGKNSCEVQNVINAWHAVGIGEPFVCTTRYIINQDYSSETYHINDCEVEAHVSTVQNTATVYMRASNWIKLKPNFHAKAGSNFHAYIDPYTDCGNMGTRSLLFTGDENDDEVTDFYIDTTLAWDERSLQQEDNQESNITLYPNPNNGSFTISTASREDIQKVEIINLLGQVVYQVRNPQSYIMNIPDTAKGTFFVRIVTTTKSVVKKIIIQ